MCECNGVEKAAEPKSDGGEHKSASPLSEYGSLDTCRGVMRAYGLYRYNLIKEKYCKHGSITR